MPKLLCRGMDEKLVKEVSKNLTKDLSELLEIPTDRFTFTVPVSEEKLIKDGEYATQAPHVRITWFERPETLMEGAAKLVRKHFNQIGIEKVEIYYENLYKKYSY